MIAKRTLFSYRNGGKTGTPWTRVHLEYKEERGKVIFNFKNENAEVIINFFRKMAEYITTGIEHSVVCKKEIFYHEHLN